MPHYHRSWDVLVQLPFEPPAPPACVTELLSKERLQCPRKAIKITGMLSWQRTQPWPELCCLECIFTLNFRPSPYQAPPSTRWITRHTKTKSTIVSYLRVEQREQGMIRHGLCSPLENFSQKLVLKKKQLKLIYLLLFISSNNKSFKRQFRLSFGWLFWPSFPRNLVIANQISYSVFQNSPIVQCATTRTQSIAQL